MSKKIHAKNLWASRLSWSEEIVNTIFGITTILLVFYVYYFDPITYIKLTTEDYWGEWITFVGFMFAFLFFGWLFLKSQPKISGVWFVLLSIASFFIAMEEISWGQRIFLLEAPKFFADKNFQGEITLHNIEGFWSNQWRNIQIAGVLFFLYGFVLPVAAALLKPVKNICERFWFPIPSIGISPLFLGVFVFFLFQPVAMFQEIGEAYMGFAIGMLGFEKWIAFHQNQRNTFLKQVLQNKKVGLLALLLGLIALTASFIISPAFVAERFSADGVLGEHTIKLIQGFKNILMFWGVFLLLISGIIFSKKHRNQIQNEEGSSHFSMRNIFTHKGFMFSTFLLFVIFLGYGLMNSFGLEDGYKMMLNDFASDKYYQNGLYQQAETVFVYIEKHPKYSTELTPIFRGRNLLAMKKDQQGLALLNDALENLQKNHEAQLVALPTVLKMAKIYQFMGEVEKADTFYQKALTSEYAKLEQTVSPFEKRSIRLSLGDIYAEMGKYTEAIAEFEKARELSANDLERREAQIRVYHTQDKFANKRN